MADEPNPDDQWQNSLMEVVWQFGLKLRELDRTNPWPELPVLPQAMATLMTELWDNGFSQTQISEAFEKAIADLPGYAAGEEVRR